MECKCRRCDDDTKGPSDAAASGLGFQDNNNTQRTALLRSGGEKNRVVGGPKNLRNRKCVPITNKANAQFQVNYLLLRRST